MVSLLEEVLPLALHTITGIVGLLANGLLFYLAIKQTPSSFKIYSILIINFAVCDFLACLTALFVQQRLIPLPTSLVFFPGGPCTYFGSTTCYISHSITLHCYSHSMWSLMISFLFRYFVLKYRTPKKREVLTVLLLFYLISITQLVIYIQAGDDPNTMRALVNTAYPQYDTRGNGISGNANIFEWKCFLVMIHICCAVFPIYLVIMWARNEILVTLKNHTNMSMRTKGLHSQLLKALTFQALLPGVFLLAVVTFALGLFGICNHPLLEYSTFLILGLVPVLSPIGTLFLVRPYELWIYRLIGRESMTLVDPGRGPDNSRYSVRSNSGTTQPTHHSEGL